MCHWVFAAITQPEPLPAELRGQPSAPTVNPVLLLKEHTTVRVQDVLLGCEGLTKKACAEMERDAFGEVTVQQL